MHDYESAAWADHHDQVSRGLDRLFGDILAAFRRLQAMRFDAPWQHRAR